MCINQTFASSSEKSPRVFCCTLVLTCVTAWKILALVATSLAPSASNILPISFISSFSLHLLPIVSPYLFRPSIPIFRSAKCGHECRSGRRWQYDSVELDGVPNSLTLNSHLVPIPTWFGTEWHFLAPKVTHLIWNWYSNLHLFHVGQTEPLEWKWNW